VRVAIRRCRRWPACRSRFQRTVTTEALRCRQNAQLELRCERSNFSRTRRAGRHDTADRPARLYFIEALTDELEAKAWELNPAHRRAGLARSRRRRAGLVQGEIEQAAVRWQQEVRVGRTGDRRRSTPSPKVRRSRSSCTASIPRRRSGSSSAPRACARSGTPPKPSAQSSPLAENRTRRRKSCWCRCESVTRARDDRRDLECAPGRVRHVRTRNVSVNGLAGNRPDRRGRSRVGALL